MTRILITVLAALSMSSQALAGFQMLVVPTSQAVAIDSGTKCSSPHGRGFPATEECTIGPIDTNTVMVTWSSPVTLPTATIGHELVSGSVLILSGITTNDSNEVNTFRAIAQSATSTVPITCTCK